MWKKRWENLYRLLICFENFNQLELFVKRRSIVIVLVLSWRAFKESWSFIRAWIHAIMRWCMSGTSKIWSGIRILDVKTDNIGQHINHFSGSWNLKWYNIMMEWNQLLASVRSKMTDKTGSRSFLNRISIASFFRTRSGSCRIKHRCFHCLKMILCIPALPTAWKYQV